MGRRRISRCENGIGIVHFGTVQVVQRLDDLLKLYATKCSSGADSVGGENVERRILMVNEDWGLRRTEDDETN